MGTPNLVYCINGKMLKNAKQYEKFCKKKWAKILWVRILLYFSAFGEVAYLEVDCPDTSCPEKCFALGRGNKFWDSPLICHTHNPAHEAKVDWNFHFGYATLLLLTVGFIVVGVLVGCVCRRQRAQYGLGYCSQCARPAVAPRHISALSGLGGIRETSFQGSFPATSATTLPRY